MPVAKNLKISSKMLETNNTRTSYLTGHQLQSTTNTRLSRRDHNMASNQRVPQLSSIRCYSRLHCEVQRRPRWCATVRRHRATGRVRCAVCGHRMEAHRAQPSWPSWPARTVISYPYRLCCRRRAPTCAGRSAPIAPDALAEAALPRVVTLLIAVGLVAVIGAAFSWWATGASVAIRGPPRSGWLRRRRTAAAASALRRAPLIW